MDSRYLIGITEIDSQHEEIETIFIALQEAIDDQKCRQDIPGILADLYDKLKFHFSYEESVMQISSYPETQEHKRAHLAILKSFESYEELNLSGSNVEYQGKPPTQLFYEQILAHDSRFARFIAGHKDRLGIH